MTWLFEEPLYIIIVGAIAVLMLGFAWYQVQWRGLLYAILGVIVLTAAMLGIERAVVTDAERVKDTLHEIARAVERNDIHEVLQYAAAGAKEVRSQASAELPRYHVNEVDIKRNLEVTIDRSQSPPHAIVTFNVVVDGVEQSLHAKFHVPQFVKMIFVKQNEKWRVLSYEHWSPDYGMKLKVKLP